MLRNIPIGVRILLVIIILLLTIAALIGVIYFTSNGVQEAAIRQTETVMMAGQQEKVRLGTQTMAVALGAALRGVKDRQEQHDIIKSFIQDYRFEDDKSGYYFTYIGTIIFMHPTLPQREGEDLGNTADSNGVYYVRELYENAQKGGGFVYFAFPKPPSMDIAPKMAYVEYIPGTDIWISTGIYIDNIDTTKAAIRSKESATLTKNLIIIIGIIAFGIIFILIPLCVFILRSITLPLKETVKAAEDLAAGKLDLSLTVNGRDEMTVLEKSFISMARSLRGNFSAIHSKEAEARSQAESARKTAEKIREVAVEIERATHEVEETVSGISRSADKVKTGGETQTAHIKEIHSSIEKLSSGVFQITDSAAKAASQSQDSRNKVEAGVNMAEQSGEAMEELRGLTGSLTENINKLGDQSEQIGTIMNVITDIADQINLLAMNASIEAAHAGEAGKGFAVVAGEVRKLADKTRAAALDVANSIGDMQKLTRLNITGMENAVSSISLVADLSQKTAASLNETKSMVNDVVIQVQSIASAAEQQSGSSKDVTSLVNNVSGIASINSQLISQVDISLKSLSRKSTELKQMVSELRA